MNKEEIYLFENDILKICDPMLGIAIEEPFKPSQVNQEYYPNGQLKMESYYKLGELHGPSRFYNETGVCLSQSWFYLNHKQGKVMRAYSSGKIYSIERFLLGALHGKQEFYYESGIEKTVMNYDRGMLHGKVLLFWSSGKKKRECSFIKGARHDFDRMWNEKGVLIDEGEYKNGDPIGTHCRFTHQGVLVEERIYHSPTQFDLKEWSVEGD